jgi:hypothetical protein
MGLGGLEVHTLIHLLLAIYGVIYLHAIKKNDGYAHATKKFPDTCVS